jgi:DNA-binding transcriptional ArsR family regulator
MSPDMLSRRAEARSSTAANLAASLGITERSVHAIVADLAQAGYVIKQKDGRRNRYRIEAHLPLPEPGTREPAISEVLALLLGNEVGHPVAIRREIEMEGIRSGAVASNGYDPSWAR